MTIHQQTSQNYSPVYHWWYLVTSRVVHALNGRWHKLAMNIFMFIILTHLTEHIVQIFQLWVLGWPRPRCMGLLGLSYPWLMKSEWLHYGHAIFMLFGLAILRPAVVGKARFWWDTALIIQFWHHLEHALLLGQVLIHRNLFNSPIPISVGQIWIPRIELHLFYNLIVLFPMLLALYHHRYPPTRELI